MFQCSNFSKFSNFQYPSFLPIVPLFSLPVRLCTYGYRVLRGGERWPMNDGRWPTANVKRKVAKEKTIDNTVRERGSGTSQLPRDADHAGHVSNVPCPLVMLDAE